MDYQLTQINSNGKQYISCTEAVWEDGLKVSEKRGFIEVQPALAQKNLMKFKNNELVAQFGEFNRQNGLFAITVHKVAVEEGTLAHEA